MSNLGGQGAFFVLPSPPSSNTHTHPDTLLNVLRSLPRAQILAHPASHLPPPLSSSLLYLLSTLLTPSSPSTSPRLTSPPLLRMAAYLTMVEKAREGGGGGEWARVHECLVEGWRGALLKEREREREESGKRREEEGRRREVVQEVRPIARF